MIGACELINFATKGIMEEINGRAFDQDAVWTKSFCMSIRPFVAIFCKVDSPLISRRAVCI